MLKGIFSGLSDLSKLFIILLILAVSLIISNILGVLFSMLIFNIDFHALSDILKNIDTQKHSEVNILKFIQIIQSVGLFIFPPFIIAFLISRKPLGYLKFTNKPDIVFLILSLFIIISCMPFIDWLAGFNSHLKLPSQFHGIEVWMKNSEHNADVLTKSFLNVFTLRGFLLNIFMIAIIPALGEELLFRALLIRFIKDWTGNKHLAIIISAVIFSIIHFQFYGFLPRMLLGILFGYLFIWSGSIWVPVFVHFLNNGSAVLFSFLINKGILHTDSEKFLSANSNVLLPLLGIITAAVFIWLFYFYSKNKKIEI